MKKHLIACGILSTMFMATSFAQKDIDRPIMGWSSWNTYHVNISEELIKQQADALIKHGLKEAGYNYINIDDGFFGYRDETGKMHQRCKRSRLRTVWTRTAGYGFIYQRMELRFH